MPRWLVRLSVACLGVATLALLVGAPALAQNRPVILPTDGEPAFKSPAFKSAKLRFEAINKPNEGEKANRDSKEDQAAVDWMAQYHTYRVTWENLNAVDGGANRLMDDFYAQVNAAQNAQKGNPAFTELYLKALAHRARDVIQTAQPVAAVSGARMLARLAEAGSEEAGDACLDALKDDGNFLDPRARAGVQYYALQGLKGLLGLWAQAPAATDAPPAGRKERESRYLQALVDVIQRKPPAGTDLTSREERAGLQVFRREAVRALAQYRNPAVTDAKGAITLPTALTLLKVVNSDGLAPRARLDEQIEATICVARLQSKAVPAYQPDYAAQQLGYLVVEVARQATPKDPKRFPWKVYAARLGDALEAMQADAAGSPDKKAAEYVDKVAGQAVRLLKEGVELNERADGSNLKLWLDTNPPPHDTLYKGMADAKVNPLNTAEEPTPEKPASIEKKPEPKKPDATKPPAKPGKPGKP